MTVSFKNPPIHEVALGYTFLSRPDLLIPHLGRFWSEIDDVYPLCQHAPPIIENNVSDSVGEVPLPRLWFKSSDDARIVQLQQDRLIVNWRDVGAGEPYVRFPAIRSEFERVRQKFEAYVERQTKQGIHPAAYNLTYVNIVKRAENSSLCEDTKKIFPDIRWEGQNRFLPEPIELAWKSKFQLPNKLGTLTADIHPAKLLKNNEPVVRFELTANSGSLGGRTIEFADWLDVAHDWIVNAFKDLTGDVMHHDVWLIEKNEE